MGKSVRKTPIIPIAFGVSDKQDKQRANRAFRKAEKSRLAVIHSLEDAEFVDIIFDINQVSNEWAFNKDGKCYLSSCTDFKRWLRK